MRPDLTAEEVHNFVAKAAHDWGGIIRNGFLRTQLFVEKQQPSEDNSEAGISRVALIWGILGLLLTLQADWIMLENDERATLNINKPY